MLLLHQRHGLLVHEIVALARLILLVALVGHLALLRESIIGHAHLMLLGLLRHLLIILEALIRHMCINAKLMGSHSVIMRESLLLLLLIVLQLHGDALRIRLLGHLLGLVVHLRGMGVGLRL